MAMDVSRVGVPARRNNSTTNVPSWLKVLVLGLAGTGIATNTALNYVNHEDDIVQQQQVATLEKAIFSLGAELREKITLDQVMDVAANVSPSTVMVQGEVEMVNFFTGETQKGTVTGSGVIVTLGNGSNVILTNSHVTEDSAITRNELKDGVYHIKVYNGTDYKDPIEFDAAPVILSTGNRAHSISNEHDFALLVIPPDVKLPDGLGIKVRDLKNDPPKVGEPVIAIGNPFREKDSVSFGIISHIDRKSDINKNHHFQTDAPINPGNSGGGLFDMQGRLIGINTWAYRGGDGVAGSIRIDQILDVLKGMGLTLK